MLEFLKSSIGRKYMMGLTGLIWVGFVLTHMAANMLILFSAEAYNKYSHALISNKLILYPAETILVVAILAHIACAISITIDNRKARDSRYAMQPNGAKAPPKASQFMGVQGSIILAFIILHLITFKYGTHYDVTYDGVVMRDLHRLVIEVFQSPAYVAGYCVSLLLLMFHLSHGARSVFQSFGFLERKMQGGIKVFAWAYAAIIFLGFISQPLYVFLIHKN